MAGNPSSEILASHTPAAIRQRIEGGPTQTFLRDFVYGAIDGTVTTFAIVAGAAGAQLGAGIVLILGVSNLIADGFSMATSNFLGSRAENQQRRRAMEMESDHIDTYPEGEREEIRQIFSLKGFSGTDLERIVDVITADRKLWIDVMLVDEHGFKPTVAAAWKPAMMTFLAFVVVGSLPLLSFVVNAIGGIIVFEHPYLVSTMLTGVAFFGVGVVKSRAIQSSWFKGGLETLFIGGATAAVAFAIGTALRGVV